MATIDYFDGKKTIKVEVDKDVETWYTAAMREEWKLNKRINRHEIVTAFVRTENVADCPLADLEFADPLKGLIEREELAERAAELRAALKSLTPEQLKLVELLRKGESVTEIARYFGVSKSAVSNMRTRIQERVKKFLH